MIAMRRRTRLGSTLLCVSLSLPCWSDDPKVSKQIAIGVFAPDAKVTPVKAEDKATVSPHLAAKKEVPDYRVRLESGETIDVGAIFQSEIEDFQTALRQRTRQTKTPMIRIDHKASDKPFLLAERRGAVLHGLLATFTEDGAPIAHASYDKGNRTSTLLTWDEAKRPLVFEQYAKEKLDGIRCLFRGCCDECSDGHPWLVQQWQGGKLQAAHLVLDSGNVRSFRYQGDPNGQPYGGSTSELDAAMSALQKFQNQLSEDEKQLKLVASRSYVQDKQRKQLETQRRNYQLASLIRSRAYAAVGVGGSSGIGRG